MAQLFVDAATSRKDTLYLGLDISTQSTGYAVLQPSTATMAPPGDSEKRADGDASHPSAEWLQEVGEANLMEWGYISGNGADGKKGDEVDVGVVVEDNLIQVAARCGRSSIDIDIGDSDKAPSSPPSPSPSPFVSSEPTEHEDNDNSSSRGLGEKGDGIAAAAGASGGGAASGNCEVTMVWCCSCRSHPPTQPNAARILCQHKAIQ